MREKFRENRSVFSANREKFRAICVSFDGYVNSSASRVDRLASVNRACRDRVVK